MSTNESNRNSSQGKQESSKQGGAIPVRAEHKRGHRKGLPFDDDDTGGVEDVVETTNPQKPPIEPEF